MHFNNATHTHTLTHTRLIEIHCTKMQMYHVEQSSFLLEYKDKMKLHFFNLLCTKHFAFVIYRANYEPFAVISFISCVFCCFLEEGRQTKNMKYNRNVIRW